MRTRFRQSGAALIALVAVLVIAVTAGVMSLVNAALNRPATGRNHNAAVLHEAKSALIGYVVKEVLDPSNATPGRFPCPEAAGDAGTALEGRASGSCSAATSIGRVPWRTLGIDKLVDSSSEPLWYAVSPNWAGSGVTMINSGTPGLLSVDGITNVVAVIIAPGPALKTNPTSQQISAYNCAAKAQVRNDRSHVPSGGDPDVTNYLECANATPPPDVQLGSTIVGNDTNPVLNDQLVYITAKDVLNAIQGPVAERVQRTVAPLLNEHSDKWSSVLGSRFLPYAVSYATSPETSTNTCGTAGVREGMLPTALLDTVGCSSAWTNFGISGTENSVLSQGCSGASTVTCTFRYYTLNALGGTLNVLLNLLGLSTLVGNIGNAGTITATITSDAPNAALSFRDPLANASVTVTPNSLRPSMTMSLTPKTTGEATLRIQVPISSGTNNLCTSILGVVCNLLPGLLSDSHTVTVAFPQLTDATVQGTLSLLAPVAGDPHYWFIQNQWHRYTYYAIAPGISAAQTPGFLTVSGLPADNGGPTGKRLVLTVVGPATADQAARPSNLVEQYLEGENASTGNDTFAHQVFAVSGNDRIATCPFTIGGTDICN